MTDIEFSKVKTLKYLIWTFGLAWLMQAGVAILYHEGYVIWEKLLMAVMMFVPMAGVLFAGVSIKDMGWNLHIKKNVKLMLVAWFVPVLLTAIGAAIYFLVLPGHFDLRDVYLVSREGEEVFEQMKSQGLMDLIYVVIFIISCLTYVAIINALFAVGEEVGWRGFLYPQLKAKYGKRKGVILGGVIWGMWHWPIIWLIGYEYGMDYVGFPVVGMMVFCVFTVAVGILCDWLYERSKCIWVPSLCHGAINAVAIIPLVVCAVNTESMRLLGPIPNGLLAVIPFVIFACVLLLKAERE